MTIETYTRAMMVRFAVEEGQRHGGVNNMLAILHVLRNRVLAGWGSWQEVVDHAPYKRGTSYPTSNMNMSTTDVRTILNRVDDIYTRADAHDLTGGALWYMDANFPVEEWFTREILGHPDDHKRTAHIGPVWFFA